MDDIDSRIARITQALLAYTAEHPLASDTVVGIAQWWLRASNDASIELVQQALDRLVRDGRFQRLTGADGADRYSVSRTA